MSAASRAALAKIPYHMIARNDFKTCEDFSRAVFGKIDEAKVDLAVSLFSIREQARFRLFPKE